MSFESVVYSTLAGDSTLAGLCPNIYPQQPQDNVALPYAVYRFGRRDHLTFGGVATGISNLTFEINCFAATQAAVLAIADRVKALLNGFADAPNVGMCVLNQQTQAQRADGYIYFVITLQFDGMGV